MSDKNISKFLPKTFLNEDIRSFMNTTTQTLFDPEKSEYVNYFIGQKNGGVYNYLSDPYAQERSKLREDYQLEPSLVSRNDLTGEVDSVLYYEDLLNSLKSSGSDTNDHNRLFATDAYTYAPPINYDMFVNHSNYFWFPEGIPSIRLYGMPENLVGETEFHGQVGGIKDTIIYPVTDGNHIILNDGKEYIVNGVGKSISLVEFDRANDLPLRVTRNTSGGDDIMSNFPKEYITIERGSVEGSPWTRNNAWYHIDAINPGVPTTWTMKEFDDERRAYRPIIQYNKDIELFNYTTDALFAVDVFSTNTDISDTMVDGYDVVAGMTAIKFDSNKLFTFDGTYWIEGDEVTGKAVIKTGIIYRSSEHVWVSGAWTLLQQKISNTQEIKFNLYNGSHDSAIGLGDIEGSNFNGVSIFSFKTTGNNLSFDNELGMHVTIKTDGSGSNYVFEDTIETYTSQNIDFINQSTTGVYYKLRTRDILPEDRFYQFSVHEDSSGVRSIYVNNEELKTIIVRPETNYVFDFGDSSTRRDGWYGANYYISVESEDNFPIIQMANGARAVSQYGVRFKEGVKYRYFTKIDGEEISGVIDVIPEETDFRLLSNYRYKGQLRNKIKQTLRVASKSDDRIYLEYKPSNDHDIEFKIDGTTSEYKTDGRYLLANPNLLYEGGLIEVVYLTTSIVDENNDNVTQISPYTLTNNPFNESQSDYAFIDILEHFNDVIDRQKDLTGSSLGINNYRNTTQDITLGGKIFKHDSSIVPLMFLNRNENLNVLKSIENSKLFYQNFKNQLVVEAEEISRDGSVTFNNVMDVFDSIIIKINTGKMSNSPFSNTTMFASERGFIELNVTTSGLINNNIVLNDQSALYVYVVGRGLMTQTVDYDIVVGTNGYSIVPHTFSLNQVSVVRFYERMSGTFCPATPQKLGIFAPKVPQLMYDTTYNVDVLVLQGHDGSKTLAYTSQSDFDDGQIDARDMIMMEFETRVYNTLSDAQRAEDTSVMNEKEFVSSVFSVSDYTSAYFDSIHKDWFFKWCNYNSVNFNTNDSYTDGDPWTFNYSSERGSFGELLKGHWKGIYNDYYGTTSPHHTPWEMLGFDNMPVWWNDEYGTDYSTNNTALWNDLEEGIIRRGHRENMVGTRYMYDNPYRRVGLSSIIPVDASGALLDPISCGITGTPEVFNIKTPWTLNDYSPAENAWRNMSDYPFIRAMLMYIMKPQEFCSKLWSTSHTRRTGYDSIWSVERLPIHTKATLVDGISQWAYDLVLTNNYDPYVEMEYPFTTMDMCLSHKMGGFVNSSEMRVVTESFSPTNNRPEQNALSNEDYHVMVHQSKDIAEEVYSGVIIERVASEANKKVFVKGLIYNKDDVVYVNDDKAYYRKNANTVIDQWAIDVDYHINKEVVYGSKMYIATTTHKSRLELSPDTLIGWKLRGFVSYEWTIMINPPKPKTTTFKVYGYDIKHPYFYSIPSIKSGSSRTITVFGPESKPVAVDAWLPNKRYSANSMVRYDGVSYKAIDGHTSGTVFDGNDWYIMKQSPRTHGMSVEYSTTAGFEVKPIEYNATFDTVSEVVEFLIGYGRYLSKKGWNFDEIDYTNNTKKDWALSAKEFMQWAVENQGVGAVVALSPVSDTLMMEPSHGVVSIKNQTNTSIYNLLGFNGNPIGLEQINVTREKSKFKIKSEVPIYFMRVGIKEYEHSLTINNETIFGDVNYDRFLGNRIERFKMSTQKTVDWDGRLYAPGYIITDNGIIPNFDTAINDIKTFNDMSVISSNGTLNELKYHNLGYQKRGYLENLNMDNKSQIDFYSGFIRQKGTSDSFTRILRSKSVNTDEVMEIAEEWAFKENTFGGTSNYTQIEFLLPETDFDNNPQKVRMVYNGAEPLNQFNVINIDYDNEKEWLSKPSRFQEDGSLFATQKRNTVFKTAGYALYDEHEVKTKSFLNLKDKLEVLGLTPELGMTIWLSKDATNGDSWSIYYLDTCDLTINKILDHGKKDTHGAVVEAFNVKPEAPYLMMNPNGEYSTITFYHVRENFYIVMEESEEKYAVLSGSISEHDLNIHQWKPLRIMPEHNTVSIRSIQEHLDYYLLAPYDGMLLYKDQEFYGNDSWEVYEYQSGAWTSIRHEEEVVNPALLYDVAGYDLDDNLMDYIRPYDPIQGLIPGARFNDIDIISSIDPVNYELTSDKSFSKYSTMEGTTWLDTSEMIYVDYHIGDIDYRSNYWGVMFPESEVYVYEWVKSEDTPEDHGGEVKDINSFIKTEEYNPTLGMYRTYYYFWVRNKTTVEDNTDRSITANQIARTIRFPRSNGLPFLVAPDSYTLEIVDDSTRLILNDVIIKIGYKLKETDTQTHTLWTLVQESSNNDSIPDFIFDKMIDSVLGHNIDNKVVPFTGLSNSQRYGIEEHQTWFRDTSMAKKIFFTILNEHLININVNTINVDFDAFGIDLYGSDLLRLDTWYSTEYDEDEDISTVVDSLAKARLAAPNNGEYIRVLEDSSMNINNWSIYQFNESIDDFVRVAQSMGAVQINTSALADKDLTVAYNEEMRVFFDVLFNEMSIAPYHVIINNLLFAMVRYVLSEQPNNDWVFPTTYISLVENQTNMVQLSTYQPSTIDQIISYIREVKPYHTKIKEYDRINSPETENNVMRCTDFDKPVYVAADLSYQLLQEKLIDTITYVPGQVTYDLTHRHLSEISLLDDGYFIDGTQYSIDGTTLTIDFVPRNMQNHTSQLVIESRSLPVQETLAGWRKSWGYGTILRNTNDLTDWARYSIKKDITITYDRNWQNNFNSFERLHEIKEELSELPNSYAYLKDITDDVESKVNIKDVDLILHHGDLLDRVVDESLLTTITVETDSIEFFDDISAKMVLLNDKIVNTEHYAHKDNRLNFRFTLNVGDVVRVIDKVLYDESLFLTHRSVLSQQHNILIDEGFNGKGNLPLLNSSRDISLYENISEVQDIDGTLIFEEGGDKIVSAGRFTDVYDGYNEEHIGLKVHESIIMTGISRIPEFEVTDHYTFDFEPRQYQPDATFVTEKGKTFYEVDIIAPDHQVVVFLDGTYLMLNEHYEVEATGIRMLRGFEENATITIKDAYSVITSDYTPYEIVHTKNSSGGYNTYNELGEICSVLCQVREFIVYSRNGNNHFFRTPLYDYVELNNFSADANVVDVKTEDPVPNKINKMFAVIGVDDIEFEMSSEMITFELIRGSIIDNQFTDLTRGLFSGDRETFNNHKYVYLYELQYVESLDEYVLHQPNTGVVTNDSYPKFGHIFFKRG